MVQSKASRKHNGKKTQNFQRQVMKEAYSMKNVSRKPEPEDVRIYFGKYKGMTIGQVYDESPSYLRWMLTTDFIWNNVRNAINSFLEEEKV